MTKVFELFEKNHIVDHVNELTPYLEKRLDKLVEKYDFLSCRRGKGFMQGLVVTGRPVGEILKKALENDLIILSAGNDVIRLVPPLVIEKEHIDEMIEKLERVSEKGIKEHSLCTYCEKAKGVFLCQES